MLLGVGAKQPREVKDFNVDYTDWLPADDSILSVSIETDKDGLIVNPVLVDKTVNVWVEGGTHNETYKITIIVNTSLGRISEAELKIKVKEE